VRTELVGCLDADSFVAPDALRRIVPFFDDKVIMAVTPSIKVHEPKTVLQRVQRVEYAWGVFLRRMLSSIDALYVTPGPFSIFRVGVFKELGGYRYAHQTEDMEMALRMQKNRFKITNSVGAFVYTVTPPKLRPLYKQRRRWTYGFLKNAMDYKDMYFNKKYGNIGMFILPVGTASIFFTLYAASNFVWAMGARLYKSFTIHQATGWGLGIPHFSFDWFFLNTGVVALISALTIGVSIYLLFIGMRMANGRAKMGLDMVYYLSIYIFIVPLWLAGALYNTVLSRNVSWR
jgi:cellulose synthase/poly-beta-1,6-N-acetylglucosamine synthase-like glycosyltransferase